LLHHWGVDAVVISNGLPEDAYLLPEEEALRRLREKLPGRTLVAKVARWDSAKRWGAAIQAVAAMKGEGWRPLLIARGGREPYGNEILKSAGFYSPARMPCWRTAATNRSGWSGWRRWR
jgi:hypothetical protein